MCSVEEAVSCGLAKAPHWPRLPTLSSFFKKGLKLRSGKPGIIHSAEYQGRDAPLFKVAGVYG